MRKLLVSLTAIFSLTATTNTFAAMNAETLKCSKAIEKTSAQFQKAVYNYTRSCFLAMQACDTDVACNDKLYYIDPVRGAKGKCAVGKLDDNATYFGEDATQAALISIGVQNSKLEKAHQKFATRLLAACDNPNVVYGGPDGIPNIAPFNYSPANALQLGDMVNSDSPYGVACEAIHQIRTEFPDYQSIAQISYDNSTLGDNTAATPSSYVYAPTICD